MMKENKTLLIALAAMLCCAEARASEGVSGAQFLRIAPTAGAASLGEASAASDGAEALFYNPAGLAAARSGEFLVSHVRWVMDTGYSSLAYAAPGWGGSYGLGLNYFSVPTIDKYDKFGDEVSGGYGVSDMALTLGYARALAERLYAGAGVKYLSSRIDSEAGSAAALDAGLRYAAVPGSLDLGLSVQNLGTGMKYGGESSPLPLNVKLGGRWSFLFRDDTDGEKQVSLLADVNDMRDPGFYANLGVDMTVRYENGNSFSVRAGYRTGAAASGGGSALGLGIGMKGYAVDYAYSPMGDLGKVHRISLSVRLGS